MARCVPAAPDGAAARDPASWRPMADLLTIDEARALVLGAVDAARRRGASRSPPRSAASWPRTSPPPTTSRASPTARWTASPCAPGRRARAADRRRVAGRHARRGAASATARRCGSRPAPRVPDGADAILPVEDAEDRGDDRHPRRRPAAPAITSARRARTCAPARSCCARATCSAPAELGLAVEAGRATLRCARAPRVAVARDRRRARRPGRAAAPRPAAQLERASRSPRLRGARGRGAREHAEVRDDAEATRAAIERALDGADVVLLTGGVSVGPHDHVKPALDGARRRGGLLARRAAARASRCGSARRGRSSSSACRATRCRRWSASCSSPARRSRRMQGAPAPPRARRALLGAPRRPAARPRRGGARAARRRPRAADGPAGLAPAALDARRRRAGDRPARRGRAAGRGRGRDRADLTRASAPDRRQPRPSCQLSITRWSAGSPRRTTTTSVMSRRNRCDRPPGAPSLIRATVSGSVISSARPAIFASPRQSGGSAEPLWMAKRGSRCRSSAFTACHIDPM